MSDDDFLPGLQVLLNGDDARDALALCDADGHVAIAVLQPSERARTRLTTDLGWNGIASVYDPRQHMTELKRGIDDAIVKWLDGHKPAQLAGLLVVVGDHALLVDRPGLAPHREKLGAPIMRIRVS